MVIRIGMVLATGSSLPTPQKMRACAGVPAVLSRPDHFLGCDSNWRNGTAGKAKSLAETAETPSFGSPYTVGKNYLAWRAGSAVVRTLKAWPGRRSGEEF